MERGGRDGGRAVLQERRRVAAQEPLDVAELHRHVRILVERLVRRNPAHERARRGCARARAGGREIVSHLFTCGGLPVGCLPVSFRIGTGHEPAVRAMVGDPRAGAQESGRRAGSHDLRDALVAFALACALVTALSAIGRSVGFVHRNLGALYAVVFLYLPFFHARRRGEDMVAYGFRAAPLRRGLAFGLGVPLILFPLFAAAFVLFNDVVCRPGQAAWLRHLVPPAACPGWRGWGGMHAPHIGLDLLEDAFVQVVVIALPEELFFRGFLHELLERAIPPGRRLLGGGIGWALVLSSALFA